MRLAIAEDSVLLREGVARLLGDAGFEVVAQCSTADELMLKANSYEIDVAIVDIRLPPTHNDEGLRAALEIRANHPSVGVLVLSQYVEVGLAMKLLADSAEGVGYLLKDRISDVEQFVAAVRRVAAGGSALDPIIVSTLLARRRSRRSAGSAHAARARRARADGHGKLESGNRGRARDHAARGREVRVEHLRQARTAVDRKRVAARAGGADVPALVTCEVGDQAPERRSNHTPVPPVLLMMPQPSAIRSTSTSPQPPEVPGDGSTRSQRNPSPG